MEQWVPPAAIPQSIVQRMCKPEGHALEMANEVQSVTGQEQRYDQPGSGLPAPEGVRLKERAFGVRYIEMQFLKIISNS